MWYKLLHKHDTANHAGIVHKHLDPYHFSEALHTGAPTGEWQQEQWAGRLCWEEWNLPLFWSTAYWSSCRWVSARTMIWSAMLRGIKVTSLLKHCKLELLQVSDRQNIDLISYAVRNETYLSSETLHTGAPAGEWPPGHLSYRLCWEEWNLPLFWSTAYWSSCRWLTPRTMT